MTYGLAVCVLICILHTVQIGSESQRSLLCVCYCSKCIHCTLLCTEFHVQCKHVTLTCIYSLVCIPIIMPLSGIFEC